MALKVCFVDYMMSKNLLRSSLYYLQRKLESRPYSQSTSGLSNSVTDPGRVVFISQSTDIYSNLAFEDWLYQNWNFEKRYLLFLWRNTPTVVIGRHQNPFLEANLPYLESAGVPVVRRNSGGGAVYHDDGNLNCSFFTPRKNHNRKTNLHVVCSALLKDFGINCKINEKDDLILNSGLKVSGTAAKLGGNTAYHHCTLLVSSDKSQLKLALQGDKTLKSKATLSVSASVGNLQEARPDISVEKLLASIGRHYLESGLSSEDASPINYKRSDGFTLINPTEDWFPGLDMLKAKLKSWEWFYGMTPLFQVTRPIAIEDTFSEGSSILITVEAFHGIIKGVTVKSRVSPALKDLIENHVGSKLQGSRYAVDVFADIENRLLLEKDHIPRYSSI